jgi:general secretion pathway protein C
MVSYLSRVANAVLFVLACFLAASTANTIFASMLAPPAADEVARGAPEAHRSPTWQDRQVILTRNLFHSSTVERSIDPSEIEEEIEATELPLELLGTAAAEDPALAYAAVLDTESRQTLVVTIGDILKEKATVVRIERRRIVLSENGAHRELTFGDEETPRPAVRTAAAARAALARRPRPGREPRVRQLADDRFAMARGEAEAAIANPQDILSQARFMPKFEGEQMVGFQVNAIKPGSILQDFGLQNGDLITEFNGIPISSPAESAQLLQEFNQSDQVSLVVQGADGSERVINVDLSE